MHTHTVYPGQKVPKIINNILLHLELMSLPCRDPHSPWHRKRDSPRFLRIGIVFWNIYHFTTASWSFERARKFLCIRFGPSMFLCLLCYVCRCNNNRYNHMYVFVYRECRCRYMEWLLLNLTIAKHFSSSSWLQCIIASSFTVAILPLTKTL